MCLLLMLLPLCGGAQAPGSVAAPAEVTIAPSKTSIYIGNVTLTLPPLVRENGGFTAAYVAKVWPFFFAGERGTLAIDFSDDDLHRLAAGETVEFTGEAENEDREPREITGRAQPLDATSGDIKVRVRVSPKIELIFNTTYRFTG